MCYVLDLQDRHWRVVGSNLSTAKKEMKINGNNFLKHEHFSSIYSPCACGVPLLTPNIPTIMSAAQINGSISSSTWTADELMHGKIGGSSPSPPASPTEKTNGNGNNNGESHSTKKQHTQSHHHHHSRFSMRKLGHGKNKPPTDPMDWGMPGHLTEEEVAVFVS